MLNKVKVVVYGKDYANAVFSFVLVAMRYEFHFRLCIMLNFNELQNATFYSAKGGVLYAKRRPFTGQKAMSLILALVI